MSQTILQMDKIKTILEEVTQISPTVANVGNHNVYAVSDDYLAYIKSLDQNNLVDISQFILVASTLILMKAKSLLPGVVYTEEEEKQVHDLERKLELYALLTQASSVLRSQYLKMPLRARERISYKGGSVFVPDARVTGVMQ